MTMAVTVCVPVWNGEAFVEGTLESVRTQTLSDITVMVSVDKCDDRSLDICRAFAAKDKRFKVFAQSTRLGWVGNVNWLLRQVNSEFASILPHDDIIAPHYLERLLAKLHRHPEAVLAYCDLQTFPKSDGVRIGPEATGDLFTRIMEFLYSNTLAVAWRGVFRSEVLEKGCYHEDVNGAAADQVWLLRLAVQGHLVRVPEILYRKRRHIQAVTAKTQTPQGVHNDSHWVDHCVSCHHIALRAGQWDQTQKNAIAVACLARVLTARQNSIPSLFTSVADYAQRLSGLAPLGSDFIQLSLLPDNLQKIFKRRLWRLLARQAVRIIFPRFRSSAHSTDDDDVPVSSGPPPSKERGPPP